MLRVAQEGAPGAGTTAPCPREQRIPRGPNTGGQTPGAAAPRPSWTIVSGRTAPPFSPSERLAGTARPGRRVWTPRALWPSPRDEAAAAAGSEPPQAAASNQNLITLFCFHGIYFYDDKFYLWQSRVVFHL